MGMGLRAGVVAAVLAGVAQTAGAQQEQVFRAESLQVGEQVAVGVAEGNGFFVDGESQRLKERLNDPQQRLALRAEHRAQIATGHPDLADALGIDAQTEQKFFDLLADQQLEELADFHVRRTFAGPEMMQAVAAAQTKAIEAQRAMLGEEAMERYRGYIETLPARLQVSRLDARLASTERLEAAQKARLITLFYEHDPFRRASLRSLPPPRMSRIDPNELAERRVPGRLLLDGALRMEHVLQVTLDTDREIVARAEDFLRPPQLAALSAMRAENVAMLRQQIDKMRAQAGAAVGSEAAREVQLAEESVRKVHAGDIKVEISVTVDDGKPTLVKHTGPNGQAIELEVDGLVVEVTPTLYEGNWLDTQLTYYEQGPNGRRKIGGGSQGGTVSQSLAGSLHGGGGSTVITGSRKAYAVETGIAAAAL